MTLRQKQSEFARCIGLLIQYATQMGYEVTFGDAYRDPRVEYGHPKSCHKKRLAVDLNLFKNGKYIRSSKGHTQLGEFWESLHPLARWGGRFKDGNHYSFEHGGVK